MTWTGSIFGEQSGVECAHTFPRKRPAAKCESQQAEYGHAWVVKVQAFRRKKGQILSGLKLSSNGLLLGLVIGRAACDIRRRFALGRVVVR